MDYLNGNTRRSYLPRNTKFSEDQRNKIIELIKHKAVKDELCFFGSVMQIIDLQYFLFDELKLYRVRAIRELKTRHVTICACTVVLKTGFLHDDKGVTMVATPRFLEEKGIEANQKKINISDI